MEDRSLHDAFVELHGERLFGFSVLVTLGDRDRAARLTAKALDRGASEVDHLRHPERAAAWLRATVTAGAQATEWGYRRPDTTERRTTLTALGIDEPSFDALAALDARGRAAIAAAEIERLAPPDVSEIVGGDDRVRGARRAYLAAYIASAAARGAAAPYGSLAERIRDAAGSTVPGASR